MTAVVTGAARTEAERPARSAPARSARVGVPFVLVHLGVLGLFFVG